MLLWWSRVQLLDHPCPLNQLALTLFCYLESNVVKLFHSAKVWEHMNMCFGINDALIFIMGIMKHRCQQNEPGDQFLHTHWSKWIKPLLKEKSVECDHFLKIYFVLGSTIQNYYHFRKNVFYEHFWF